ncbi:MAG: hypothetical protein MI742_03475 [Desulfobacterales bacterium]|nr:hypothetical protein [Desulfobacterales bacterium]
MKFTCRVAVIFLAFASLIWPVGQKAAAEPLLIDETAQLNYAQSLFHSGEYSESAREYSRYIHFFPEGKAWQVAHYARALAWYQGGDFKKAGKAFGAFREAFKKSSLGLAAGLMEAQCRNRLGDPASGVILLGNMEREESESDALRMIRTRMAWTRLEMGDLPRAERLFQALSPETDQGCGYNEILGTLDRFKTLPEKSPLLAGSFAVIPGGGYLYLGRYQDAIVSFFMNVALGLAASESFDSGHNALGAVISFVGLGFYSGNIHGSYNGAKKANRAVRESLWRDMLFWGAELEKKGNESCLGLTLSVPFD